MPENEKHLFDQIDELVQGVTEARSDGTVTFSEMQHLGAGVFGIINHAVNGITDPGHLEDFIDSAEKLFDKYFAPIDIKPIPNFIEPTFDGFLRSQIRPTLTRIYQQRK